MPHCQCDIVRKFIFLQRKIITDNLIMKPLCYAKREKIVLKNFTKNIVKNPLHHKKCYTQSRAKGWGSGIAGAFDWIYG